MRILVTTDFSVNSKGAIRFVKTLANQSQNIEAVFYHAINIMQPTSWSNDFFDNYRTEEMARLSEELKKLVHATLGEDKKKFASIKFVIDDCASTEEGIISFAEQDNMDFVCIASQGAGMLRRIIGTHTSYIVNNSKVPVMVIPSHYFAKPLKNITYLSDFDNLSKEINEISTFAKAFSLQIEVLHYSLMLIDEKKEQEFEKNKALFNTKAFENIKLNIQKSDFELSLVDEVTDYVEKSKPELLIMFTNRDKSFFESLFLPSKSAELTYTTKVPVLIFSK